MADKTLLQILAGLNVDKSVEFIEKQLTEVSSRLKDVVVAAKLEGGEQLVATFESVLKAASEISNNLKSVRLDNVAGSEMQNFANQTVASADAAAKLKQIMASNFKEFQNYSLDKFSTSLDGSLKTAIVNVEQLDGTLAKLKLAFDKDGEISSTGLYSKNALDQDVKNATSAMRQISEKQETLLKKQSQGKLLQEEENRLLDLEIQRVETKDRIKAKILQSEKLGLIDSVKRLEIEGLLSAEMSKQNALQDSASLIGEQSKHREDAIRQISRYKQVVLEIAQLEKTSVIAQREGKLSVSAANSQISKLAELKTERALIEKNAAIYEDIKNKQIAIAKIATEKGSQKGQKEQIAAIEQHLARYSELYELRNKETTEKERLAQAEKTATESAKIGIAKLIAIQTKKLSNIEKEIDLHKILENGTLFTQNKEFLEREKKAREDLATQRKQEIAQLQEIKGIKDSIGIEQTYGKVVPQTQGGNLSKLFESGDKHNIQLQDYFKNLVGANAQIERLNSYREKSGQITHKLIVTEDKLANQKRMLTYYYDQHTNALRLANVQLSNNISRNMMFIGQMAAATKKILTYAGAARILYLAMAEVRKGFSYLIELDKELTQVAIVQQRTRGSVEYLREEYTDLAIQLGKTSQEISKVNTELIRQGLSLDVAANRMKTIMMLSSAGAISADESLKIITASVNAMQVGHMRAADIILKASQISAVSVEQLGEAFTKTASSAFATGMQIEEVGAILSTLVEVTQEGSRELGTALKTILARFNRVNEDTGEWNESLNDVQKAMEAVGVAFLDSNGQIRDTYSILSDLSDKWKTLDKNQQAYVATQAAGVRQQNRFFALMNNFNRVQAIKNELEQAHGSLLRSNLTYMSGIEAQQKKFQSTMQKFWNQTGTDMIEGFYSLATAIANVISEMGTAGFTTLAFLVVFRNAISALVGGGKAIHLFTNAWQAGQNAYKATKDTLLQVNVATAANTTANEINTASTAKSTVTKKGKVAVSRVSTVAINQETSSVIVNTAATEVQTVAQLKGIAALKAKAIAAKQAGVAFLIASAPLLAFAAAATVVGLVLYSGLKHYDEQKKKIKEEKELILDRINSYNTFTGSLQRNRLEAEESLDRLAELNDKIKEMGGIAGLTALELDEYRDLNAKLLKQYSEMPSYIDSYGQRVVDLSGKIDLLKLSEAELYKLREEALSGGLSSALAVAKGALVDDPDEYKTLKKKLEGLAQINGTSANLGSNFGLGGKIVLDKTREMEELEKKIKGLESSFPTLAANLLPLYQATLGIDENISAMVLSSQDFIDMIATADTEDEIEKVKIAISNLYSNMSSPTLKDHEKRLQSTEENYRKNTISIEEYNKAITEEVAALTSQQDAIKEIIDQKEKNLSTAISTNQDSEMVQALTEELVLLKATLEAIANLKSGVVNKKVTIEDDTLRQIHLAKKSFEDLNSTIDELGGAYQKLAKGEKLSSSELSNLIQKYPEIKKHIAGKNDLTLEGGNLLIRIAQKEREAAISSIEGLIAQTRARIKYNSNLKTTIEGYELIDKYEGKHGERTDFLSTPGTDVSELLAILNTLKGIDPKDIFGKDQKEKIDLLDKYFHLLRKVAEEEEKLRKIQDDGDITDTRNTASVAKAEIQQMDRVKQALINLNKARINDLPGMKKQLSTMKSTAKGYKELAEEIAKLEDAIYSSNAAIAAQDKAMQGLSRTISENLKSEYEKNISDTEKFIEDRIKALREGYKDEMDYQLKMAEAVYGDRKESQLEEIQRLKDQAKQVQELVKKQVELLKKKKEEDDWNKRLKDSNKAILDLQYQIGIWSMDTSIEGKARLYDLEKKLAEARAKEDEMLLEKSHDDQIKALEDYGDSYTATKDKEIKLIEDTQKEEEKAHANNIKRIKAEYDERINNEKYWDKFRKMNLKDFVSETNLMLDGLKSGFESMNQSLISKLEESWGVLQSQIRNLKFEIEKDKDGLALSLSRATLESDIKSIMQTNSSLWGGASNDLKRVLSQTNLILGELLGWTRNSAGQWMDQDGKKAYHSGGLVGGKSFDPRHEEIAKLLKGELVVTPRQLDILSGLIFPKVPAMATAQNNKNTEFNITIEIDKVIGDKHSGENIADGMISELKRRGLIFNIN